MFEKLIVHQVLAVFAGEANYKTVGSFETKEMATEAVESLKRMGTQRVKVIEQPVFRSTADPSEVYAMGEVVALAKNLDDLERRRALLKLTSRERELLNLTE